MPKVGVFVGSVFGNAENLACDVEQALVAKGHQVTLYDNADMSHLVEGGDEAILVVTSTTGQGELPDNLQLFYQQLTVNLPQLTHLPYGLITLGDSSYQNFCGAGDKMEELFQMVLMIQRWMVVTSHMKC